MDQEKEKFRLKRQLRLAYGIGVIFLFAAWGIAIYMRSENLSSHDARPFTTLYIVCAIVSTIGLVTGYFAYLLLKSLEGRSSEADRVHLGTIFFLILTEIIFFAYIYFDPILWSL